MVENRRALLVFVGGACFRQKKERRSSRILDEVRQQVGLRYLV